MLSGKLMVPTRRLNRMCSNSQSKSTQLSVIALKFRSANSCSLEIDSCNESGKPSVFGIARRIELALGID